MEVIRVIKSKDYTTICNRIYKNTSISLKAKGLLSMILSLSPHWQLSVEGLVRICKEGRTSIGNTIRELIDAGYIEREMIRIDNKFAGYKYIVFESASLPKSGNLQTGNLKTENLQQLNTISNKIINNKVINNRFVKPSIEEIKDYCLERKNNINADRFFDYYESTGWKIGKNKKMKCWKAAIRTWENRNKEEKGMNKMHKHLSSHLKAQEILKNSRK